MQSIEDVFYINDIQFTIISVNKFKVRRKDFYQLNTVLDNGNFVTIYIEHPKKQLNTLYSNDTLYGLLSDNSKIFVENNRFDSQLFNPDFRILDKRVKGLDCITYYDENIIIGNNNFVVLSYQKRTILNKCFTVYNTLCIETNNPIKIITYSEKDLKYPLLIEKEDELIVENLVNQTMDFILLLENDTSFDKYSDFSAISDNFNECLYRIKYSVQRN